MLKFLRAEEAKEPGTFPFLAIKAADYPKTDYKFVERMNEKLATLNRQQLCVFEQAKARIALINSKVYQEQMSTDELDTQLKKHECAGGPTVEVFFK